MMAIPAKYVSKVGLYDVTVHNVLVKVRAVENAGVIRLGLSELESEIGKSKLVGIMVKKQKNNALIVLCVKSRCLVIQMCRIKIIPKCLKDFLSDTGICFVGPAMKETLAWLSSSKHRVMMGGMAYSNCSIDSSGMEVGDLAAKVLQDPTLLSKKWRSSKPIAEHLQSIADKAGVALQRDSGDRANKKSSWLSYAKKLPSIDLAALAFSPEEINLLVADVYASYLIAVKLLDSP